MIHTKGQPEEAVETLLDVHDVRTYVHPRCTYARDRCHLETPLWREVSPGHFGACHFSEELELRGVSDLG